VKSQLLVLKRKSLTTWFPRKFLISGLVLGAGFGEQTQGPPLRKSEIIMSRQTT